MASDDEFSELTELESDDAYSKKKQKSTTNSSGKPAYKIKNALKAPRATTYTAQALYEQIHSCDINLEPEYQRDVVWPETKQIGIIDSIFRNFYIPPVIFSVNTYEDGSETKTCIDGKQRLTSIHKFMDGLIPHKDPLTGEKLWFKDVQTTGRNSRARRILSDEYRKTFANKQIVCVEYQDITDADEREIFQRVQLGMALTPSEKLQVINSPRASFIRELTATYLKEDGWLGGDSLEWDRSRGADFRCLSQAIFCMEKISGNLKGVTVIQLEKWLNLQDPLPSSFQSKISDTYRIFAELVQDRKFNKVFKKPSKISPVEFTTIGLLVYTHKDTLTMGQLSNAIAKMRGDVRDAYVDIRMNSRVMKHMIDFIKSLKMDKIPGDTGGPAGATGSMAGLKRKRVEERNESEDDDEHNGGGGNDNGEQKAKNKKKAISKPAPKPTLPTKVKAEAQPSPSVPKPPPPDRMAALRRAKDTIAQQQQYQQQQQQYQQQQQQQYAATSNSFTESNPQMLPSPNQTFSSFPQTAIPSYQKFRFGEKYKRDALNDDSNMNTSGGGNSGGGSGGGISTLPARPLPVSVMETSVMATMMRPNVATPTAPISMRQDSQQPPPLTASTSSSRNSLERGSWDRDREREREWEWERDRDRDRDRNYGSGNATATASGSGSGGGSGRYHDYDERHRRDSNSHHGYSKRSSDDYTSRGGRSRGWVV